jgi:hypothetical protein
MPAGSSPPCASLGVLLDDEAASTAASGGRGNLGFRRLAARQKGNVVCLDRRSRGGDGLK